MSGCRIWSLATIGRDSGSGGAVHVLVHPPSAHPIDHQVAQPRGANVSGSGSMGRRRSASRQGRTRRR
jgi:hypothetical protein